MVACTGEEGFLPTGDDNVTLYPHGNWNTFYVQADKYCNFLEKVTRAGLIPPTNTNFKYAILHRNFQALLLIVHISLRIFTLHDSR